MPCTQPLQVLTDDSIIIIIIINVFIERLFQRIQSALGECSQNNQNVSIREHDTPIQFTGYD